MSNEQLLDPVVNLRVKNDLDDVAVKSALKVIDDDMITYPNRTEDYLDALDFVKRGYEYRVPGGTRVFESKAILQALWRLRGRMKPLDCAMHGTGATPELEKFVSAGVGTVMDEGGFASEMRDKMGVFPNKLLLGDAFLQVGIDLYGDYPLEYRSVAPSMVYVDKNASTMRGRGGKAVTKMVIITSHTWGEACKLYPELKKIGGPGKIPRSGSVQDNTNKTLLQETFETNDEVEIAYYYDISNDHYLIFAGDACTILKERKGDDYPFIMKGKAYIPVMHFKAFESVSGFWNYGIIQIMRDIAEIQRQLLNSQTLTVLDGSNAPKIVSLPAGTAEGFIDDYIEAEQSRAEGYQGIVTVEYDSVSSNKIGVQDLSVSALTQDYLDLWERLDKELRRFGINLDDISRNAAVTATQINSEEDAQNLVIKQMAEENATEYSFSIEVAMDGIMNWVEDRDETLINTTTSLRMPDGSTRELDSLTLGDVKEELLSKNYFPKVNARTGTYPSNTYQQAQLDKMINMYPPGSPASLRSIVELGNLNDRDITIEELGGQFGPTGPAGPGAGEGGSMMPGEEAAPLSLEGVVPGATEKLSSSAKSPTPAF